MTTQNFQQVFKKTLSTFKNSGLISDCFYHDKSECKGEIKQAHSIQRNKRLSIIEGEVNGQNVVYTFTEIEYTDYGGIKTLKPIGKNRLQLFLDFVIFMILCFLVQLRISLLIIPICTAFSIPTDLLLTLFTLKRKAKKHINLKE